MLKKLGLTVLLIGGCLVFGEKSFSAPVALPEGQPIYGVTLDSVNKLPAIVSSLQGVSKKLTARIVFDEYIPPADYRQAVNQIHPHAYIMGLILDSSAVRAYSLNEYTARVNDYIDALGDEVDIWEIGNEVNGEWLGKTATVVDKIKGAYDIAKAKHVTTALTLYYNETTAENPKNKMFTWAEQNLTSDMKNGLDYVFVSYYPEDCGPEPDWNVVFARLQTMFPNSKIGFGEVGTSKSADKAALLRHFYNMTINQPNYVGGYFWWYFKQDMVPNTKALYSVFKEVIDQRP